MESALGWIGKLFEYLGSWIPRPFLVKSTQRGVRFKYGKHVSLVEPGIHVYVPLFTQVELVTVVQQALEFKPCVLMTKDKKTIAVGFTMMYEIVDAIKAITMTDFINQTIGELGESLLPPLILSMTLDELVVAIQDDSDEDTSLNHVLSNGARYLLEKYGVSITYCRINNFAPARILYLVNNVMNN